MPRPGAAAWSLSPLWTVRSLGVLAPPSARVVDRDALPDGTVRLLITGAGSGAIACELAPRAEALSCGADVPVLPDSARLAKQSDALALWGKPRDGEDVAKRFAADGAPLALTGDRKDGPVIAALKKSGLLESGSVPPDATPHVCRHADTTVVLWRHGSDPRRWPMARQDAEGRWQLHHLAGATMAPPDAAPTPSASTPTPPPPKRVSAAQDFGVVGLLEDAQEDEPSGWGLPPDMRRVDPRQRAMFGDAPADESDVSRRKGELPAHVLTCHDGAGRVTWREIDGATTRLFALRCDATACALDQVALNIDVKTWWTAASVASDRTLVVWRGPAGVLRMRLAPLAELDRSDDVAVMASEQNGGPSTRDLEAFVSSERALFLFRGGAGVHGLLIGADGNVRALNAAKE